MANEYANLSFDQIFPNATLLTDDFLKNECSFELKELEQKERINTYRNYYLYMCEAVKQLYYMRLSPDMIERFLDDPIAYVSRGFPTDFYERLGYGCCCRGRRGLFTNITDPAQRHYIFLKATFDQLLYDRNNGRDALLRGEFNQYSVSDSIAPDALYKLDMLGFRGRTFNVK